MKQEILKASQPPVDRSTDIENVFQLPVRAQIGKIYLISGHKTQVAPVVQELVHHFAARGELKVIVGGNRFSLERLPIVLGEGIGNLHEALDRVKVSRGETCYQLLHALQKTPAEKTPLIVMDMLDSFYDEDLTEGEVSRVLENCLLQLQRLSQKAPLLISASVHENREHLLAELVKLSEYSIELWPEQAEQSAAQLKLI